MDRLRKLEALPTDLQIKVWRDKFVKTCNVKKQ